MKLSELIADLLRNLDAYGDIEVFTDMDWCYSEPDVWTFTHKECEVEKYIDPGSCKYPECVKGQKVLIL
jgi:hypothetical protein